MMWKLNWNFFLLFPKITKKFHIMWRNKTIPLHTHTHTQTYILPIVIRESKDTVTTTNFPHNI